MKTLIVCGPSQSGFSMFANPVASGLDDDHRARVAGLEDRHLRRAAIAGPLKGYNRRLNPKEAPKQSGSQWSRPLEQEEGLALTPQLTYLTLLIAQTLHLLHHRLAKRHISFAEVISGAILCVPLTLAIPATLYMSAHLTMVAVQLVGSLWIRRLSPVWS